MRALSALVFLVLAGSAVAAALGSQDGSAAEVSAVATAGSFSFASSGDGEPIFSASGIAPGDSTSGSVEIANSGGATGALELTQHDLADVPGSGGGELSTRLKLRITDVTAPAHPLTIYAGPLAPMPAQAAGRLQPGESRTYEFVATLPEAGPAGASAQNDVQGASTSVAFAWAASEVTASPEPPNPTPTPPAPNPSSNPAQTAPSPTKLRLSISRVRHRVRHGHLLIWAGCNTTCRITARGRLRVRGSAARPARFSDSHRPSSLVGTQRLKIPVPQRVRRQLEANPGDLRLIARVVLRARNSAGETAAARRTLLVR